MAASLNTAGRRPIRASCLPRPACPCPAKAEMLVRVEAVRPWPRGSVGPYRLGSPATEWGGTIPRFGRRHMSGSQTSFTVDRQAEVDALVERAAAAACAFRALDQEAVD